MTINESMHKLKVADFHTNHPRSGNIPVPWGGPGVPTVLALAA